MKTAPKNIILVFVLLFQFNVLFAACELYNINFIALTDSTNEYDVSCGDVSSAQWTVTNNQSCVLTTSGIILGGTGKTVATPISIEILNSASTVYCDDYVIIQYQIDNGSWVTQDSINVCSMPPSIFNYNFNVVCGDTSAIKTRVIMSVSDINGSSASEKLRIRDGGICISSPIPINPMPVELIDFAAILENGKVKLNWRTATEKNNDYFTVERSEDGASFDVLEIIDGAGNSNEIISYLSTDENPTYGTTYYRLKQTDYNGDYVFSNTVSVKNGIDISDAFKVYPNPCEGGTFNLTITNCKDKEVLVVLFDAMGNQVYSKVVLEKNDSFYTAIDPKNKLNPGIYMVVASSQEKVFFNHRLIVR